MVKAASSDEGVRRWGNGSGDGDGLAEEGKSNGTNAVGLDGSVEGPNRRDEGSGSRSSWLPLSHEGPEVRWGGVVRTRDEGDGNGGGIAEGGGMRLSSAAFASW